MDPEDKMYQGEWATEIELQQPDRAKKEFISTGSINDCLTDNIKTNNGTLVLSRDFIRGIVESIVLKSNLKLNDTVPFMSSIEKICDQLIGPELEASYPACTLDLNIISKNISLAIQEQLQPGSEEPKREASETKLQDYYNKVQSVTHSDMRNTWELNKKLIKMKRGGE